MFKILVPTDFGTQSEIALDFAIQIAEQQQANITVLHVVNFPAISESNVEFGNQESWARIVDLAEREIKVKMEALYAKYGTKDIVSKVMIGSVLEEILQFQREGKFDLLVLGAKETHGIGAFIFGTVTDRIVHKSSIPVLVIKQKTQFHSIKRIIFGNAYKVREKDLLENMAFVKSLFESAKIDLVRVNTPADFMSEDVFDVRIEKLRGIDIFKDCLFHSINHANQGNGLIYYAAKSRSDLIVIGDKHSSTIRRWFIGEDLAERVMDFANTPVLVL